jgi:hypothetical protein
MDDAKVQFIDPSNPEYGISLLFDSPEKCGDNDTYSL